MAWRVGASRRLPIVNRSPWDGDRARESIFRWAGWPDNPRPLMARRLFLVYNTENPELKGSYKLPFGMVIDGRPVAVTSGIRAAASRLPQTDIPSDVKARARRVLESYLNRMKNKKKKKKKKKKMSAVELRYITSAIEMADGDEGQHMYRAVINTDRLDRYDSIIYPDGVRFDDYLKYGAVLFNHNPNYVVGKALTIEREGNRLVATFVFDEEDEFALQVKQKVDRGFLRGTSVGIRVQKSKVEDGVLHIERSDLVEFSVVSLPANPDALVLNSALREIDTRFELTTERMGKLLHRLKSVEQRLEALEEQLEERLDEIAEQLLNKDERKEQPDEREVAELVRQAILKHLGKI